jgi:hypothetical protein
MTALRAPWAAYDPACPDLLPRADHHGTCVRHDANAGIDLRKRTCCHDCGRDIIALGHHCMVLDEVWQATGLGPEDGTLCLAHLQQRLGRWLRYEDFQPTDRDNRASWQGARRMVSRVWRGRWAETDRGTSNSPPPPSLPGAA